MIKEAIAKVITRTNLTEAEAEAVMREIMQGEATDAQISSYITALRMKGETVEEITGSARVMREKAVQVRIDGKYQVDTCGTGGDMAHTFNISTTAAFVVAAAGVTVAKHGNRSVSSKSGSADVLQALGVNIEMPSAPRRRMHQRSGHGLSVRAHDAPGHEVRHRPAQGDRGPHHLQPARPAHESRKSDVPDHGRLFRRPHGPARAGAGQPRAQSTPSSSTAWTGSTRSRSRTRPRCPNTRTAP